MHAVCCSPRQYQRVEQVFASLYAVGQGFDRIVRLDRYRCLGNDRAAIQLLGDEMDAAAVLPVTGGQGALVGVEAGIAGQ